MISVVGVGTGGAEGREREGDEVGTAIRQRLGVEAERKSPEPGMAVDQDVGPIDQPVELRATLRRIRVETHAALVGVQREEEPAALRIDRASGERAAASRDVSRRRLDIHHVGPVVAEQPRSKGARDALPQLEDADLREGPHRLKIPARFGGTAVSRPRL